MQKEKKSSSSRGFLFIAHLFGVMLEIFISGMIIVFYVKFNGPISANIFVVVLGLTWCLETLINWCEGCINEKSTVYWTWMPLALILHIIGRILLFSYAYSYGDTVPTYMVLTLFTFFIFRILSLIAILSHARKHLKMKEGYESLQYWYTKKKIMFFVL